MPSNLKRDGYAKIACRDNAGTEIWRARGKTGELTRRWFSENCCDVTSGQASKIVLRFLPSIDDYRSEGCVSARRVPSRVREGRADRRERYTAQDKQGLRLDYTLIVPDRYVTALPPIATRSPLSRQESSPPRSESCNAWSCFFPKRCDQ